MNLNSSNVLKPIKSLVIASLAAITAGCASMSVEKINAGATPTFDFVSYFEGHRKASGWFADRFGNVKRHFCGDFIGTLRDDGALKLDERLVYSDGLIETRVWLVNITDDGKFIAESDSLVGTANGVLKGNTLNMQYVMNVLVAPEKTWKLSMDDYMILQPDGSLHNITQVKKFGIRIGSVSTQYSRPTATEETSDSLCVDESNQEAAQVANFS